MVGAEKGRLLARRSWPSESRVYEEELLRGRSDEVAVGFGSFLEKMEMVLRKRIRGCLVPSVSFCKNQGEG